MTQALEDGGGSPATAATLLTDVQDPSNPASILNIFSAGSVLTLQGVEKGGKALGNFTFEVGPANTTLSDTNGETLGELMQFLEDVLGIDSTVDGAGVTINGAGEIEIVGNIGTVHDLSMSVGDMISTTAPTQPLRFSKEQDANGEAVRTTFVAFDSLGTPLTIDLSIVLISKDNNGTTWRYYSESRDDTDLSLALGTGELTFDSFGQLMEVSNPTLAVDRFDTGAINPLSITMDFGGADNFTALTDQASTLAAVSQDGSAIGTLDSFSIGEDGIINGAFTNGLTRTLGQVALNVFSNPEGLSEAGANMFRATASSGDSVPVTPQTFGAGRIISGALELSNVDLSQEFVNLITINTGFSASARVISTSDELLQQLLAITV